MDRRTFLKAIGGVAAGGLLPVLLGEPKGKYDWPLPQPRTVEGKATLTWAAGERITEGAMVFYGEDGKCYRVTSYTKGPMPWAALDPSRP